MDKSIKFPHDIEKYLELPILGTIPAFESLLTSDKKLGFDLLKRKDKHQEKEFFNKNQLITVTEPTSVVSEAYRSLRTNLLFSKNERKLNSLLVSSAIAHEGKSTVAANLGVILTYLKQKVLLIDADLRHPTLHKIFNIDNSNGLMSYLQNKVAQKEIIKTTDLDNLHLITSGGKTMESSELVDSDRMRGLIQDIYALYDIVLIDSVTATSLPDAIVLSTLVDGVIIVHQPGSAERTLLQHIKKRFTSAGATVYGVVLNNLSVKSPSYYYYPYMHSYYEYYVKDGKSKEKKENST